MFLLKSRIRPHLLLVSGLGLSVCIGIWVNLFSAQLQASSSDAWLTSARAVGWGNLWLVLGIAVAAGQIGLGFLWARIDRKTSDSQLKEYLASEEILLHHILEIAIRGIQSLQTGILINGRYFVAETGASGTTLRKLVPLHVETDPMPDEYGLDYAEVGQDNLVICDSFLTKSPIYKQLHEGHISDYGERIRSKVDPAQRWVLACPVFQNASADGYPHGVICFYSTMEAAKSDSHVRQLKATAVAVANAYSVALQMRRETNGESE